MSLKSGKTPARSGGAPSFLPSAPRRQRRRQDARAASTRRQDARAASARRPDARAASTRRSEARTASTFAALGDRTRLSLLGKLSHGFPCSISQLTHGSCLTRQAITKHLRILERARIVRSLRSGRHALFQLDPEPVHALRDYLDRVSAEWDQALARLKSFVEK